jgi:hypothetical protein
MATVGDIVSDVITELSQVPGIATQLYASGRIRQHVQDAITLEQDEAWWPQTMFYQLVPLDGLTGSLTQDLKGPIGFVDEYSDIQAVYPEGSNRKMSELPLSVNPFNLTSTGIGPVFISPDQRVPHRPFRVWPDTATGSVAVLARQAAKMPVSDGDVVLLDRLLITYDACWMYCVDDGTVPAQVNKFQMLAVKRRKQAITNTVQMPTMLDPRFPADPTLTDELSSVTFVVGGKSGVLG